MKRRWLFFLFIIAIALAAAFFCVFNAYRNPKSAFTTPSPSPAPRATPTAAPTLSPEEDLLAKADTDFMAGRVNILLLGFDQSPERDDENEDVYRGGRNGYRSDVLMLLAVNFEKNTAHLISVPRDTYSPIYNTKGRYKINAAFAKGGGADKDGFTYAVKTVEMLFGVPVDYYAGVNMQGLKNVVDALGGVDYDVDVEIHLNGRTLEKGYQHLNGQQVLDYCRARKGISTDAGRNDRQQRMLLAIFEELREKNKLTAIPKLFAAVSGDLYTNLSLSQVAALASFALDLGVENIARTTLEGEYVSNVYNASYYVLKNKALIALVKEEFGVIVERSSRYDLSKVKRDKAAAEAKRRAEALEKAEQALTVPAGTMEGYEKALLNEARYAAQQLTIAVNSGADERAIKALSLAYDSAVKKLLSAYPGTAVPEEFKRLALPDG